MNGSILSDDESLKRLGKKHFSDLFMDDKGTNITNQLEVIRIFPKLVLDEDVDCFLYPITLQEVEYIKGFKKDKIPGPDGWLVEFFLAFFDLIGGGTGTCY